MRFRYVALAVTTFLVWHLVCHTFNLYFKIWWTDIVAHFLAGFSIGLFWWWLTERRNTTRHAIISIMTATNIISLATTLSAVWEFWEYANWRWEFFHQIINQLQIRYDYRPDFTNTLADLWWGSLGGVLAAVLYLVNTRKKS